ncbi:MAG: type II secretion system F family protein [Thermoplasmata archaeon]|nr:type II secretion system F family protein [Thermoplasmata archaeon]
MSPEVEDAFKTIETTKEDMLRTKELRELGSMGPHLVRLPKGLIPQYIKLAPFQEFAWKTVGHVAKKKYEEKPNDTLEINLMKAHMRIRPEEHMAAAMMTGIIAGVTGVALAFVFFFLLPDILGTMSYMLGAMMLFILPVGGYFGTLGSPGWKAKARARDIDKKLPAAMNFVSAMASANVNIDVIFKELSRQPLYGEIQNEAEWITRDTELLGMDIITAIRRGATRSPSEKFADFLQGVVTTTTSGGQLKPYFLNKSEQFEKEGKLEVRSKIETLGLMAESFVTIGVAFPLFLVIIMAIFAVISSGSDFIMLLLYAVIGGMIPGIQVGFIVGISAIGGEED